MNISAVIVIRNEASNLIPYFEHVRRFCDEIIVVDQQSGDNSVNLACKYADKVYLSKNVGYNELDRGFVIHFAKNDWICTLDPDERFSNKFLGILPKLIEKCDKEGYDAISCLIQNVWDGIEVSSGSFEQIRLSKKSVPMSTRIHTTCFPKKCFKTTFIQYHFKDLTKSKESIKRRQQYYDDDRIKNNITNDMKRIEEEIDKLKEEIKMNRNKYSTLLKYLKKGTYLIVKGVKK